MIRKSHFMLLFFTLFIVACQPAEEETETVLLDVDEEAIKYLIQKYDNAINSGDANEFMSIYAHTAVAMPPGRPVLFGADAIRARIAEFLQQHSIN